LVEVFTDAEVKRPVSVKFDARRSAGAGSGILDVHADDVRALDSVDVAERPGGDHGSIEGPDDLVDPDRGPAIRSPLDLDRLVVGVGARVHWSVHYARTAAFPRSLLEPSGQSTSSLTRASRPSTSWVL
jgi:hypothetical protein